MIVELFGAPAAGKTRLVRELTTLARPRGITLRTVTSDRPAEHSAQLPAVLVRAGSHGAATLARRRNSGGATPHSTLLRLFPPRSLWWSIRLGNYIRHLDAVMHENAAARGVFVLDQGFIQALGSLMVLARHRDATGLTEALAMIPRGDLMVRLRAPDAALRHRHAERLARMSWTERWLELDLDDSLAFVSCLDEVQARLEAQGARVVTVDSSTPETMLDGAAQVLAELTARGCATHPCPMGGVAA